MLAAKGYRVAMELTTGRVVRPKGAMLHDESGKDWPYRSVIFMPFSKRGDVEDDEEAEVDAAAIRYFGYEPLGGRLELPDDEHVDDWDPVGEVSAIDYSRPGGLPAKSNGFFDFIDIWGRPNKNFKGDYEHEFKNGWLVFKGWAPRLYKQGRVYRLEFPPWAEINWRGFVTP